MPAVCLSASTVHSSTKKTECEKSITLGFCWHIYNTVTIWKAFCWIWEVEKKKSPSTWLIIDKMFAQTQSSTTDVHVAVHRAEFLITEPTRCNNFSKFLFLEWNSTCFRQFLCPSSGVFHCTHSNGICHTGLLTACEQEHLLLLTSTEELPETCRVSF